MWILLASAWWDDSELALENEIRPKFERVLFSRRREWLIIALRSIGAMWRRFGVIRCCVMGWRVWCDGMVEVLWCWLMAINMKEIEIWNPKSMWVSLSVCLWERCYSSLWDLVWLFCFLVISRIILPFHHFLFSQIFSHQTEGSELASSVNHPWSWNLIPTLKH